jgi:hypothetical protein
MMVVIPSSRIPWFGFAYEFDVGRVGRQTTIGRVRIDVDGSTRFSIVVKRSAYNQICPAKKERKKEINK